MTPRKILYVDDEQNMEDVIRQRMRRRVRKREVEVIYANSGRHALEQLAENKDTKIVFTDINMPEMDGLELLSHIHADYPNIYTVVVSAYGDMTNIRTAMNSGAFDFVTKPIDFNDFDTVLLKLLTAVSEEERVHSLERNLSDIQHEMDYAGRLQSRVLPTEFPQNEHFDIFARMTPARDVGGDFYDVFELPGDYVGFLVADVSGKGISAAIFMAISRTIFHVTAHSMDDISADQIISVANRMICKENPDSFFVTMQCCLLNLKTGELKYANAGHMPPFIIGADGTVSELPCAPSVAVGIMDSFDFQQQVHTMKKGDTIYMYTDGVSEANNSVGEIFTTTRLLDCLKEDATKEFTPRGLLDNVWKKVILFRGDADQYDDITQLALQYK